MPRWLKKSCFASLFALVACGGSGGGGCGGCSGVNPLPQGFPKDSRIENSANLRFTDSGFAFLSDNLGTLATKLLPAGGNGANVAANNGDPKRRGAEEEVKAMGRNTAFVEHLEAQKGKAFVEFDKNDPEAPMVLWHVVDEDGTPAPKGL